MQSKKHSTPQTTQHSKTEAPFLNEEEEDAIISCAIIANPIIKGAAIKSAVVEGVMHEGEKIHLQS